MTYAADKFEEIGTECYHGLIFISGQFVPSEPYMHDTPAENAHWNWEINRIVPVCGYDEQGDELPLPLTPKQFKDACDAVRDAYEEDGEWANDLLGQHSMEPEWI